MRFGARVVGKADIPEHRRIVLDHERITGRDFAGEDLIQFLAVGCRLEKCSFEGSRIADASFGAGRETSEYVDCNFDRARLEISAGGYARFVRCSFRNTDIRDWFCFAVEIVDCTFSGRLQKVVFNGSVPEERRCTARRTHNEFCGNDFGEAELIDVDFRTGIDLARQRLPNGPDYLYLPDAASTLQKAQCELTGWKDDETRRVAMSMVGTLSNQVAQGQKQLLLRARDYYGMAALPREAVDALFALLRS